MAALAPHHIDVGEDALAEELVAKVREAVGVEVQIGLVYLVDVSGEDYLSAFSGTGDDGLDLVRSEVLGLVHDEEDVAEAAAADIGQRVDYQFLATEHILDLGDFLTGGREAALDDVQVVEHTEPGRKPSSWFLSGMTGRERSICP